LPMSAANPAARRRRFSVSAESDKIDAFEKRIIPKTLDQQVRIQTAIQENFLFQGLDYL